MLARLITQKMGESMKQSFVVENVGGAGGSLGAEQIAKAAPDGYSLLFHNLTFSTTTSSLQYAGRSRHDIEKDFVPISIGAYVPMLLLCQSVGTGQGPEGIRRRCEIRKGSDVLRLHRSGQRDELFRRVAEARCADQARSYSLQGRGAAGNGTLVRPHPVRRRSTLDIAATREVRLAAPAGRAKSEALARHCRMSRRFASRVSPSSKSRDGTASSPRPVRQMRSFSGCTRRSSRPSTIRTSAPRWRWSAPSLAVRRRRRCATMLKEQISKVKPVIEDLKLVVQ